MRTLRWMSLALGVTVAAALLTPAPVRAQQVDIKPTAKVKRDKYIITADEIAEHPDLKDGYDVVKSLRNQWLRITRGSGSGMGSGSSMGSGGYAPAKGCLKTDPTCTPGQSSGGGGSASPVPTESGSPYAESGASLNGPSKAGPVIYINEIKREGLDDLKTLRPTDIAEMRYMTGTEASGRYGQGHENGAILVKTVAAGRP